MIYRDDPRLQECPDVIPNVKRAWAMKVWLADARQYDSTFVNRQSWWIESMTYELWPEERELL